MANLPNLSDREVIIGGGAHAAVYAATRVKLGKRQPVVLEAEARCGGVFTRLSRVPFWMNSASGASVDSTGAGPTRIPSRSVTDLLNWLPNCEVQADGPGSDNQTEYPLSTMMGSAIRRSLARAAEVYTGVRAYVTDVARREITTQDGDSYRCGRIIDARGLNMDSRRPELSMCKELTPVITAEMFLRGMWPSGISSRGPQRVALVGGGDTACVVAEALLGQGPEGWPFAAESIDWFAVDLPGSKSDWLDSKHARYAGLARHFPQAERRGMIRPRQQRVDTETVQVIGDAVRVGFDTYDLAVFCTGFQPAFAEYGPGLADNVYRPGVYRDERGLWRRDGEYYIVGTAAGLAQQRGELDKGYSRFPKNTDALYRLAPETAKLAALLDDAPVSSGY
ncbi:MAG TPA: hypothetical protein VHE33_10085 [Acidobacteriaceae bacterium]|nr:hypothetical protein [Acidobacteriaceae bacterium]